MTRRGWHSRAAPAWWPADEPWPPRSHAWKQRRAGFVRRIAVAFAILLVMSGVGTHTLLTALLQRAGLASGGGLLPVVAVAAAMTVLLLAAFLSAMRRFAFPLGDLVGAADRVAQGDLSARVAEQGPPALRSVTRAFNSMTARLEAQEHQRRQLMSDVAHELRTPIAVLQARLEGLVDGIYPRDEAQLKALLAETLTLGRLVEDVRTLANAESGTLALQKEATDLGALLHDAASSVGASYPASLIRIAAGGLPAVEIDPVRIREVVVNLLSNAAGHAAPDGQVEVRASVGSGVVTVAVEDHGPGIAPEDLPRIFDRFYKGPGSTGSGLGLTIARNLARAHGGEIRADSVPGRGTTMTLTLPVGEVISSPVRSSPSARPAE